MDEHHFYIQGAEHCDIEEHVLEVLVRDEATVQCEYEDMIPKHGHIFQNATQVSGLNVMFVVLVVVHLDGINCAIPLRACKAHVLE